MPTSAPTPTPTPSPLAAAVADLAREPEPTLAPSEPPGWNRAAVTISNILAGIGLPLSSEDVCAILGVAVSHPAADAPLVLQRIRRFGRGRVLTRRRLEELLPAAGQWGQRRSDGTSRLDRALNYLVGVRAVRLRNLPRGSVGIEEVAEFSHEAKCGALLSDLNGISLELLART